jgi:hypothetical protein
MGKPSGHFIGMRSEPDRATLPLPPSAHYTFSRQRLNLPLPVSHIPTH